MDVCLQDLITRLTPSGAEIGGFQSPFIFANAHNARYRTGLEISESLEISNGGVYVMVDKPVLLFMLEEEPLMNQLLHLRNFYAPESYQFFSKWTEWLRQKMSTEEGRRHMFTGPALGKAVTWFETPRQEETLDVNSMFSSFMQQ